MKLKDWLGVGVLIAVGLMCLGGCGPKDTYLKMEYPLKTECIFFASIEKQTMREFPRNICRAAKPGMLGVFCTRGLRPDGKPHRGRHHRHILSQFGDRCEYILR